MALSSSEIKGLGNGRSWMMLGSEIAERGGADFLSVCLSLQMDVPENWAWLVCSQAPGSPFSFASPALSVVITVRCTLKKGSVCRIPSSCQVRRFAVAQAISWLWMSRVSKHCYIFFLSQINFSNNSKLTFLVFPSGDFIPAKGCCCCVSSTGNIWRNEFYVRLGGRNGKPSKHSIWMNGTLLVFKTVLTN